MFNNTKHILQRSRRSNFNSGDWEEFNLFGVVENMFIYVLFCLSIVLTCIFISSYISVLIDGPLKITL